jgi:hypothetical protein
VEPRERGACRLQPARRARPANRAHPGAPLHRFPSGLAGRVCDPARETTRERIARSSRANESTAHRRVLVRRAMARGIGAGTGGGAVRFGGCLQASARTRGCEPCNPTRSMDAGGGGTRRVSHRNRDVGETRLYPVQPFRWVIPVGRRISENPVKLLLALLACGACRTNLTDLRL